MSAKDAAFHETLTAPGRGRWVSFGLGVGMTLLLVYSAVAEVPRKFALLYVPMLVLTWIQVWLQWSTRIDVRVADGVLHLAGRLKRSRHIPVSEITEVKQTRSACTDGYICAEGDVLLLTLEDGTYVSVSTTRPDELTEAIRAAQ